MLLRAYLAALDAATAGFTALVRSILAAGYDPDDAAASRKKLEEPLAEAVRTYRVQVYQAASEFLLSEAERQGVTEPIYIPDLAGYPADSVASVLREELRGPTAEVSARVSARLSQHVLSAGRQTVVRTVEDGAEAPRSSSDSEHMEHTRLTREEKDALQRERIFAELRERRLRASDGVDIYAEQRAAARARGTQAKEPAGKTPQAWARVLTGAENCGFCITLASRGPVYTSAEAAGQGKAADVFKDADATGLINTYHPRCDCLVVPVYDYGKWAGRDSFVELRKLYREKVTNARWTDEEGKEHKGITARSGPSNRDPNNQVFSAMEAAARDLEAEGETLPTEDLRR